MAQRPQPSLRLADGGSFLRNWAEKVMRPDATAKRLREADAPPPPPAAPASAPVRAPAPPPPNPNATPDNPAGIRFQDGGVVPGTGTGDKIPAKYEPGEFVVSNDMIDDNPGLREQLSGLRAETLAARGKTVEEADAKALRYHGGLRGGEYGHDQGTGEEYAARLEGRNQPAGMAVVGDQARVPGGARLHHPQQVSLRAADGFDPLDRMARNLTGQNSLPPKSPVGNMADDLARNARAAPPTPPPGPTNPGMANPQARAAYADMARGPAATPPSAAQAAARPGIRAGLAAESGALSKGAYAGGRLAAFAVKAVPAAVGADVVSHFNDYKIDDPDVDSSAAGTWGALKKGDLAGAGRSASKGALEAGMDLGSFAANALDYVVPGKAPVSTAYDRALRNQFGSQLIGATGRLAAEGTPEDAPTTLRKTAPGAPTQIRPEDTFAGPPAAAAGAASPATDPGAPRRVDRPGQSPLFTNVADDAPYIGNNALMARGNGPNAQNMAAADALAGTQHDESMARVQARMAAEAPRPTLRDPSDARREQLMGQLQSREVGARKSARLALAAMDQKEQAANTRYSSDNSLRGSMYSSDSSLRGQVYSSDAQLGAKRMEVERSLRQQQVMGELWEASGGDPAKFQSLAMQYGLPDAAKQGGDMVAARQTQAKANSEDAQSTFKGMFLDKDGKPDAGGEAMAHHAASQIVPGWENMSQEQRNAARPRVVEYVNMLQQANNNRDTSWLQKAGITKSSDMRSQMPDMTGATLSDVGWWEGATTPNIGRGDKKVTLKSGAEMHFDSLNEAQKRLLEINGVRQQK